MVATGSTFSHTEEFLSILDVPPMSKNMFYEIQDKLGKVYSDSSIDSMQTAGEEQKKLAIENNDVDEDGILWITVYRRLSKKTT
ncbi:hypothetical protein FQR65_LT16821 [Abscondita terminalis]|nr:hypothetical protein FQR65_LT16821 [Abscondita terminalis]